HRMIRGVRHGMYQGHRLLPSACRRDGRWTIRILLEVPFGERRVIATFSRVKYPGRRLARRRLSLLGRGVRVVILGMRSLRLHGHDQGAILISNNVHGPALPREWIRRNGQTTCSYP